MRMKISIIFAIALALALSGCAVGDEDSQNDGDSSDDDSTFENDNFLDDPPVSIVVTTTEMMDAWKIFADWKNRTGFRTDVLNIEEITEQHADNPTYLRAYIQREYENGLRYVILGGDADQIPYMRSYTEVKNWAMDFNGVAPVQTYFEELDADWDADQDGLFGEEGEDITAFDLRNPKVAVGRAPFDTASEVEGYVAKVIRYEAGEGQVAERATAPLLLADLADTIPILGDIDSGIAHEQLVAEILPDEFVANMRRLYGTQAYAEEVGAQLGTTQNIFAALEDEGYAFVVANTHGNFRYLTQQLSSYVIPSMVNETPFVFVTTSCLSGNFADESFGEGLNDPQVDEDSVAEELIKNPDGGAVAYVGNTLIGLGPAGGAQFNHAFCRALFLGDAYILGDAVLEARRTFHAEDIHGTFSGIDFHFTTETFPGSEWYTQRSVIVFGDPTLRIWTSKPQALELSGPEHITSGSGNLIYQVISDGELMVGAIVTYYVDNEDAEFMALLETDQQGTVEFPANVGCEARVTAYRYGFLPATLQTQCESH
jgi:Peptidase family C25